MNRKPKSKYSYKQSLLDWAKEKEKSSSKLRKGWKLDSVYTDTFSGMGTIETTAGPRSKKTETGSYIEQQKLFVTDERTWTWGGEPMTASESDLDAFEARVRSYADVVTPITQGYFLVDPSPETAPPVYATILPEPKGIMTRTIRIAKQDIKVGHVIFGGTSDPHEEHLENALWGNSNPNTDTGWTVTQVNRTSEYQDEWTIVCRNTIKGKDLGKRASTNYLDDYLYFWIADPTPEVNEYGECAP